MTQWWSVEHTAASESSSVACCVCNGTWSWARKFMLRPRVTCDQPRILIDEKGSTRHTPTLRIHRLSPASLCVQSATLGGHRSTRLWCTAPHSTMVNMEVQDDCLQTVDVCGSQDLEAKPRSTTERNARKRRTQRASDILSLVKKRLSAEWTLSKNEFPAQCLEAEKHHASTGNEIVAQARALELAKGERGHLVHVVKGNTSPAKYSEVEGEAWLSLGVPRAELDLHLTLPTGQSFRWRHTGDDEYTGVIGQRLICLKQTESDVIARCLGPPEGLSVARNADPAALGARKRRRQGLPKPEPPRVIGLRAPGQPAPVSTSPEWLADLGHYFNLSIKTGRMFTDFSMSDTRFSKLLPHLRGYRILRQEPVECLFQFICSSNNNISRITGMVQELSKLGTPLGHFKGHDFFAFPTIEQLLTVQEQQLRDSGFGYRAKFIVDAVQVLVERGGRGWLDGLRGGNASWAVAEEELSSLPGVGPKVAACVALFSLDQHAAIPVDTHVWRLAVDHYCLQLKNKSITAKARKEVVLKLVERFGDFAGWAVNAMFIAELPSLKKKLKSLS